MKKQFTLTFLLMLALCGCSQQNPVLTICGGRVQGVPASGTPDVLVFKGIPYAAPPVGGLRWQAPQSVTPWEGVRVCDTFGPIAPQPGNKPGTFYGDEFYWEGTPVESEDCLYLNVWAPAATVGKPGARLPVAMWIHGGAYMNGYGYEVTMDGEAWARRGVILVTINYRLGALGFLSHPELTVEQGQSGNYGTMDQIAALQWVHDNIAAFGGDPDKVTIFGQSAGAMSVKTLMAAPAARDLIAGAIIQSGGGLDTRGLSPVNDIPQAFYDAQGQEVMDKAGLKTLADLRAATLETLLQAGGWFFPHLDDSVLTDTFEDAILHGQAGQIPVMIGYNKDDMAGLGGASVDRFCEVRDSLGHPVYEYEFLRELPTDEAHPASAAGAFHSAELWYMFGTLDRSWRPFTEADHQLSKRMLDAWTAFCRSGNPGWPAYKKTAPFKELFDIDPDNGTQKISFLGDSYTTFEGYIPEGNLVWYYCPPDTSLTDVSSVDQTWWHQVVTRGGYNLDANESYSGATISYTGYDGLDFTDRSFITRLPRVGSPDILVILGGTNDSWAGAPVGEYKYEDFQTEDLYYYRPALAKLLRDAMQRYPKTRLLFVMNSELREDITDSSEEICAHYGVPFLQLYDIEKKAGHPDVEGMKSIANQVLTTLKRAK